MKISSIDLEENSITRLPETSEVQFSHDNGITYTVKPDVSGGIVVTKSPPGFANAVLSIIPKTPHEIYIW